MTAFLATWAILATLAAIVEASKTVTLVLRATKLEHLVRATRQRADNAEQAALAFEQRCLVAESIIDAELAEITEDDS